MNTVSSFLYTLNVIKTEHHKLLFYLVYINKLFSYLLHICLPPIHFDIHVYTDRSLGHNPKKPYSLCCNSFDNYAHTIQADILCLKHQHYQFLNKSMIQTIEMLLYKVPQRTRDIRGTTFVLIYCICSFKNLSKQHNLSEIFFCIRTLCYMKNIGKFIEAICQKSPNCDKAKGYTVLVN